MSTSAAQPSAPVPAGLPSAWVGVQELLASQPSVTMSPEPFVSPAAVGAAETEGMLMVDLHLRAADALVCMRAHAFAHDIDLHALASSIVDGTVHLGPA